MQLVGHARLFGLDGSPNERLERRFEVGDELGCLQAGQVVQWPAWLENPFEERGRGRVVLHDLEGHRVQEQEGRRQALDHLPVQKQTVLHPREPRRNARDAHFAHCLSNSRAIAGVP